MSRMIRFRLRSAFIVLTCVCLFTAYGGTYYQLSRRGMQEAEKYDMDGFLYVPMDDAFASEDLSAHYRRCTLFAPANWIDYNLLGGTTPIVSIIFRLS